MDNDQAAYDYQRIATAIRYLHDHFRQQPTLEEVADAASMSPYHFQRMFTSWAGISPKKYLQHISTSFAKTLMKGGDFSLQHVAYATGLSGSGRLHDLFVTLEAMTPGEYKNGGSDLTIRYGFYHTPFGQFLMGNTDKGICYLSFVDFKSVEGGKFVPLKQSALSAMKSEWPNATFADDNGSFEFLARRIFSREMFTEDREKIRLNVKGTPFQVRVWEALLKIPAGKLSSYQQIAELISKPSASRAVGAAIGKNPVAILIPCHRVIRQSGGISGYRWGPERKLSILSWEQCQVFTDSETGSLAAS